MPRERIWKSSSMVLHGMPIKSKAALATSHAKALPPSPGGSWQCLFDKHSNHPALDEECVYAMPPVLLDLVLRKLPALLTMEEEQFERDLAEAAICGFFRKRQFEYPPLTHASGGISFGKKAVDLSPPKPRTIMKRARTPVLIQYVDPHFQQEKEDELARAAAEQWRWAYAAWLAINPDFRSAVHDIRSVEDLRETDNAFPELPGTIFGTRRPLPTLSRFSSLYEGWNLQTLATWDLPIPIPLIMDHMPLTDVSTFSMMGVTAFVPWYMLRHRSFDLLAYVDRSHQVRGGRGLDGWLNAKGSWGADTPY
jgi:hypothetical protein